MANSLYSSSFHIVPSSSSSPFYICSESIFYLDFFYLIEFIMPLHVRFNNYEFNFARSRFWFKFGWAGYSTNPKTLQSVIRSKISQTYGKGNGEPLYPTNCNMSSSSNHSGPMILHCELDLFYDTPIICGCSKCKGLIVNPRHVNYPIILMIDYPKLIVQYILLKSRIQ